MPQEWNFQLFTIYLLASSGTDCRRTFSNWRTRCLLY